MTLVRKDLVYLAKLREITLGTVALGIHILKIDLKVLCLCKENRLYHFDDVVGPAEPLMVGVQDEYMLLGYVIRTRNPPHG